MRRRALLKVFCCFACLIAACLGGAVSSFGASREASGEIVADVAVVQELDFDSYEELVDWLRETTDDNVEYWELLRQLQDEEARPTVRVSAQSTPSPITLTKPFRFRVTQLQFRVGTGDCGLIVSSRIDFSLEWFIAPTCCAFFRGPNPSATREQVVAGQSTSATAHLIFTGGVPNGAYSLTFRATGFGGQSAVAGVEIRVQ
jgi:hypothetical protein